MPRYEIELNEKQTKEILKIIEPNLKDHSNDWEEFELYLLKNSKNGRLYLYTSMKGGK